MSSIKSLGQKIKQCEGLLGTDDATAWEQNFISSLLEQTKHGEDTRTLSEKQIDCLERVYRKNFA